MFPALSYIQLTLTLTHGPDVRKHRENVVTEAETDSGGGSWPVLRHASVKTGL